ncbi:LacI family DNA-binding transcriptional regulator [Leifsonia sp. F6_8S_P_1B]|uniref:LacI family DNA-binding transcriptional regulator n=1 Tax=Leifsonia williamsii TaxID=3035919 RepID=A0ABT8KE76_9MICO|nr:LacI family DNA-binding transcriptional regulator [Leifsonia williamsii]MDN4615765.1 LacI family DNA-binding transcriptional regulator [Leifsonia williamsii]
MSAAGRVTIAGLAARLGLSKASVSYALNGQPGVSDETRERVLALADELGWHPSSSARALSRSLSDTIGIVLRRDPELLGTEPYYMSLLAGVEAELSATGQSLLLRMVGTAPGQDVAVYRRWSAEGRVDGVMLFDITIDDPRPRLLDELGLAFVLHGNREEVAPGRVLRYDAGGDAGLIVRHLAGLGHRRALHIQGPGDFEHEQDRRTAVAAEAVHAGMTVAFETSDYSMAAGERLAARGLAADPGITAVITSNDLLAHGAQAALAAAGRDDVALVAWDDSLLCRLGSRPITALDRSAEEQGRRATRMLLDQLYGLPASVHRAKPSRLVVRSTSLPAREGELTPARGQKTLAENA